MCLKYLMQVKCLIQAQHFSSVYNFYYKKIGQFYHQVVFVNQCLGKGKDEWLLDQHVVCQENRRTLIGSDVSLLFSALLRMPDFFYEYVSKRFRTHSAKVYNFCSLIYTE
jgi:hypothetical protein